MNSTYDPFDFIEVPALTLDEERRRAFEAMASAMETGPAGGIVPYSSRFPKHEFLTYLVEQRGLLLHGSNEPDIAVMEPRPNDDYEGRPKPGVYACSDAFWAMYFAIANRRGVRWSLRNDCFRDPDPSTGRRYYQFSINEAMAAGRPWTDGTIYILPSDTFERTHDRVGYPVEEWVSAEAVRPLARLPVGPGDFPYLDRVTVHGDHQVDELQVLGLEVIGGATDARELPDGWALRYDDAPVGRDMLQRFIALAAACAPSARLDLVPEADGALWLHIHGGSGLKALLRRYLRS